MHGKSWALTSLIFFTAGVLQAGAVYVPLTGHAAVGASAYLPEILISNTVNSVKSGKRVQLAHDSDGTTRGAVTAFDVGNKQTLLLRPLAADRGLVEFSGANELTYAARLVTAGGEQLPWPVISSANAFAATKKAYLQGVGRTTNLVTDLSLVNLAAKATTCTVSVVSAAGAAVGAAVQVALKPLSQLVVADVFAARVDPAVGIRDAVAVVSCKESFYAHAVMTDSATGELAAVLPGLSGDSALVPPGEEPACPAGAHCFETQGVVHTATAGAPSARVSYPMPPGTFTRFRMSLTVTVGNWYGEHPDWKNLVYWFVINKNIDMPGMLYFRGPAAYTAMARHGINATHPQKKKIVTPFQAVKGRSYRCVNDYDMGRGVLTITVTDTETGEVRARLVATPNVSKYTFDSDDRALIDMGFIPGLTDDEGPSFGWVWSDVKLEIIP
jgi:hypothetical protein